MRWSDDEDRRLREMYATHTRAEIAKTLGRTEGMVRSRCWTLGLASKVRPWSESEVSRLRAAYDASPPLRLEALAAELGRDKANVCRKARQLGLSDQRRRKVVERKVRAPMFATAEERSRHQSAAIKAWQAKHGHPRGALGMKHRPEALARMSEASRRAWMDPASALNSAAHKQRQSDLMIARIVRGDMRSGYTRCAGGRREDLGNRYFRSSWEANYARYLDLRVSRGELLHWEYEAKTFVFERIKRGTRAYTPDFKVTFPDGRVEWHEVKGWMDQASRTRLRRMAKYFPEEVVRVIDEGWFRGARRSGLPALIPNWEGGRNRGSRGC